MYRLVKTFINMLFEYTGEDVGTIMARMISMSFSKVGFPNYCRYLEKKLTKEVGEGCSAGFVPNPETPRGKMPLGGTYA